MRILHVVWTLESSAGGPPVVVTRLAASQAALGHEVSILTYAARLGRRGEEPPCPAGSGPVTVERIGYSRVEYALAVRARRRLREVVPTVDLVHIHGVWAPIALAAGVAAVRAGTPFCIAPHGMLDPWSLNGQGLLKRLKKRAALALAWRRLLNAAAFLHLLNADEALLLGALALRPPCEILPNGVSLEELEPPPAPRAPKIPGLHGRPYVLFLSRLHAKKGLDVLSEAFASIAEAHPGVDLVVAGPDDGAEAQLRREVQELGLDARVHFAGPLFGPDKAAALVGCRCFCLPSRQEGFSIAVLEAMACGRAVVISQACHFPEVEAAGAGLVVPCAAHAVAGALDALLRDEEQARRMGAAGRRLVQERYTWNAVAAASIEAYARALGRRRGGVGR